MNLWSMPRRAQLFVVGLSVLLAACGSTSTASGPTIVNLGTTNWATIPTTPPTLAPVPTTSVAPGLPGELTTTVTEYTLQPGDNPTKVAAFYEVSLDELNAVNAATSGYSAFFIGLKIKIPVGARIPESGEAPGVTLPPIDLCIAGTYTLVQGDFPGVVAQKFKVTAKALDQVNEDVNGYGGFIVGTKINIPCGGEPGDTSDTG